jgi:hypothetical protein
MMNLHRIGVGLQCLLGGGGGGLGHWKGLEGVKKRLTMPSFFSLFIHLNQTKTAEV